jgi:hypothetical protein
MDCEKDEISISELKRMVIRMIEEFKENAKTRQ